MGPRQKDLAPHGREKLVKLVLGEDDTGPPLFLGAHGLME